MTFAPETYLNGRGNTLYKALAHPLATEGISALRKSLASLPGLSIFDPHQQFTTCDAFLGLSELALAQRFCADQGKPPEGFDAITHYRGGPLLVLDFDYPYLGHLKDLSGHHQVFDLNAAKLPPDWISRPDDYLSPLNFVTDFALFHHQSPNPGTVTQITTANYWSRYGADQVTLRCLLLNHDGQDLAQFDLTLNRNDQLVQICSDQVAAEHGLGAFAGQLFMHAIGAAGHDVMKYVCDQHDSSGSLTTTHDANSWPADRYAGIPLPAGDQEQVDLWIQNPHQRSIAGGSLSLSTADGQSLTLDQELAPLATHRWRLPSIGKASQVILRSGRQLARPRYEVQRDGKRHLAHANVVREDLGHDPHYWDAQPGLGRGYLLVAPLLDPRKYSCELLLTPMSSLASPGLIRIQTFAPDGSSVGDQELAEPEAGNCAWQRVTAPGTGHLELSYDPHRRGPVDGWLHAIFRYQHRQSGHTSETSFGAHMFNMLATYRREPQSYNGQPPGLRTRLFGRPAPQGSRGWFSLIYPVSHRWHGVSDTRVSLCDANGKALAQRTIAIEQSGSSQFFVDELFDPKLLQDRHQLHIRDTRCRLFGYHGLVSGRGAQTRFSIDHLFGF